MVNRYASVHSPKQLGFGYYCGLTLTFVWKEGNFFYAWEWGLMKVNPSNSIPYPLYYFSTFQVPIKSAKIYFNYFNFIFSYKSLNSGIICRLILLQLYLLSCTSQVSWERIIYLLVTTFVTSTLAIIVKKNMLTLGHLLIPNSAISSNVVLPHTIKIRDKWWSLPITVADFFLKIFTFFWRSGL